MRDGFKLFGFYRAKVTEVDIPDYRDYGAIRVFIPDLMSDLDPDFDPDTGGLIAYPANNPIGGRNDEEEDSYYYGTVYVPRKGSWVWVFFEGGNPNRPFYVNAIDIRNTKLPPENRDVDKPHLVYTVLKSPSGRTIVVCDSEDQQRVEITGKKRKLTQGGDPAGNPGSVYEIDGNQTVILLDERDGKEKLLIRTHKGDYINIDIENQTLNIEFASDIHIKTKGNLNIKVLGDYNLLVMGNMNQQANSASNLLVANAMNLQSMGVINVQCAGPINRDGAVVNDQSGQSQPAQPAQEAQPKGTRD